MEELINQQVFEESVTYYYDVLKKAYLEAIEEANDKQYAKAHYQRILFIENEMVPYRSILFRELQYTYHHFYCLSKSAVIKKTFGTLDQIKKVAKKRFSDGMKYLAGDKDIFLADWYLEQMETGEVSLEELLVIEANTQKLTDENLLGALALNVAGKRLYREFKREEPLTDTTEKKHKYQFTRNEQILALYFLISSFGVNLYQVCDRTKLAALFHLIMGVSYEDATKIKDLSIYKGLSGVPQVVKNKGQLLKYLDKIRPYFENAGFEKAVELIDDQIDFCKKEQK